jgi:hypothetical protein
MKRASSANIHAVMYDGVFEYHCDCVESGRCRLAHYHIEPPEPGSECVFTGPGGTCENPLAIKDALIKLRRQISDAISMTGTEDDEYGCRS